MMKTDHESYSILTDLAKKTFQDTSKSILQNASLVDDTLDIPPIITMAMASHHAACVAVAMEMLPRQIQEKIIENEKIGCHTDTFDLADYIVLASIFMSLYHLHAQEGGKTGMDTLLDSRKWASKILKKDLPMNSSWS